MGVRFIQGKEKGRIPFRGHAVFRLIIGVGRHRAPSRQARVETLKINSALTSDRRARQHSLGENDKKQGSFLQAAGGLEKGKYFMIAGGRDGSMVNR